MGHPPPPARKRDFGMGRMSGSNGWGAPRYAAGPNGRIGGDSSWKSVLPSSPWIT